MRMGPGAHPRAATGCVFVLHEYICHRRLKKLCDNKPGLKLFKNRSQTKKQKHLVRNGTLNLRALTVFCCESVSRVSNRMQQFRRSSQTNSTNFRIARWLIRRKRLCTLADPSNTRQTINFLTTPRRHPVSANERPPNLTRRKQAVLQHRKLVLLLDYDGTLTPIVKDPSKALLSERVSRRQTAVGCRLRPHALLPGVSYLLHDMIHSVIVGVCGGPKKGVAFR